MFTTIKDTYKIVFFDIDGTLVNKEGRIPMSTKESIKKLKESNIEVVIASGRGPSQLSHISKELEIDSFVSLTGSYAVYKGEIIYNQPLPTSTVKQLIEFASQNDDPIVYLGSEGVYVSHIEHPHVHETFVNWLRLDYPMYLQPTSVEIPIYQFLLYCPQDREKMYEEQFSDLHFIRWHPLSSEITSHGGSKAKGIEAMLNYLDISPDEAVAFGDALNDREMLSFVGMGIAMRNAHDAVKPYAKFTTKHIDDDGIYYGLKKIGLI
ncbi:Cof-type HAD-IIB family hydrolase [Aneurinibacillus tyrosinisolvens]|uniref:Cof-type HAD-IIB family hydrolase n=1 Tax=Aneurinibacillus tyrosinisolvens TaxID=1443435 RepID=UPI000AE5C53B|nr:Cof-type HAD-IIB family hydrolase [Aneurinibacillus tyrosinisolvens]